MEEIQESDVIVDSRCLYCDQPVAWIDSKTGDYFAREHLTLAGAVICAMCYVFAGILVRPFFETKNYSASYSIN